MTGKQQNNNTQNKGGEVTNNNNKLHNRTPRQIQPQADVDEMTAREDEYNKFNKNTVNPQPQITPNK